MVLDIWLIVQITGYRILASIRCSYIMIRGKRRAITSQSRFLEAEKTVLKSEDTDSTTCISNYCRQIFRALILWPISVSWDDRETFPYYVILDGSLYSVLRCQELSAQMVLIAGQISPIRFYAYHISETRPIYIISVELQAGFTGLRAQCLDLYAGKFVYEISEMIYPLRWLNHNLFLKCRQFLQHVPCHFGEHSHAHQENPEFATEED